MQRNSILVDSALPYSSSGEQICENKSLFHKSVTQPDKCFFYSTVSLDGNINGRKDSGMSATIERDIAISAAKTDFKKALLLARKVSEPWFQCQALAEAARFAPDEQVVPTAEEAITAGLTATDSYQRVAVTAWPLRALIERGQEQKSLQLLPNILALSAQIEIPVSRSDALLQLWEAFFPVEGHEMVLGALVQSCTGHWKADYIVRQVVMILASTDIAAARELASSMPEGKYKRQAEKRLAEGQKEQAWRFFY